jgi:hypothetical protein
MQSEHHPQGGATQNATITFFTSMKKFRLIRKPTACGPSSTAQAILLRGKFGGKQEVFGLQI